MLYHDIRIAKIYNDDILFWYSHGSHPLFLLTLSMFRTHWTSFLKGQPLECLLRFNFFSNIIFMFSEHITASNLYTVSTKYEFFHNRTLVPYISVPSPLFYIEIPKQILPLSLSSLISPSRLLLLPNCRIGGK